MQALEPAAIERDSAQAQRPLVWAAFTRTQTDYLDMVRGIAAQLVLFQHCADDTHLVMIPGQIGNLGVTLFFLLSGFLITDSVRARLAAGRFSLTEFSVSRFTRIFLPYLPAFPLVALCDYFSSKSPLYPYAADFNWHTAIANVFMLQDFSVFQLLRRLNIPDQWWFVREFGSARQFWTISIEWWIYVCIGVATALLVSRRHRRLLIVVLCVSAIEPLYNLVAGPGNSLTGFWILGGAASVTYRVYHHKNDLRRSSYLLITAGLAGLAALRLLYTHFQIYDLAFVMLLCVILFMPIYVFRRSTRAATGLLKGISRLSFHSYSLYLTHSSIVTLIVIYTAGHLASWQIVLLSILVANLVAIPFAFAFERPQKKLRGMMLRWLS